jgi:hypothetical protein
MNVRWCWNGQLGRYKSGHVSVLFEQVIDEWI